MIGWIRRRLENVGVNLTDGDIRFGIALGVIAVLVAFLLGCKS